MGSKILNFNIFWVFRKKKYLLGYEDFVEVFLGSSQNWTIRGYFYAFLGLFLRSLYKLGIFLGLLKFQKKKLGYLKFLIIFGGEE